MSMSQRRITVKFVDGEERELVIDRRGGIRYDCGDDGKAVVAKFGRNDGSGWYELLAAPLTSIINWG